MIRKNDIEYDEEYEMELAKAREEYKDLIERGEEAMGDEDEFDELMRELYTDEELQEFEFKAALLDMFLKSRPGAKIDMKKFEELSNRVYEEFKKLELVEA